MSGVDKNNGNAILETRKNADGHNLLDVKLKTWVRLFVITKKVSATLFIKESPTLKVKRPYTTLWLKYTWVFPPPPPLFMVWLSGKKKTLGPAAPEFSHFVTSKSTLFQWKAGTVGCWWKKFGHIDNPCGCNASSWSHWQPLRSQRELCSPHSLHGGWITLFLIDSLKLLSKKCKKILQAILCRMYMYDQNLLVHVRIVNNFSLFLH